MKIYMKAKYSTLNTSNTGLLKCRSHNKALSDYWKTADVLYLMGDKPSAPGNTRVPAQEGLSGCVCYTDVKRHMHSENILLFKCTSHGLFSEDSFTICLSSSPYYQRVEAHPVQLFSLCLSVSAQPQTKLTSVFCHKLIAQFFFWVCQFSLYALLHYMYIFSFSL